MAVEAELSLRSRPAIPHHHHPSPLLCNIYNVSPLQTVYVCHNFNSSSLVRPSYLQMLRGIAISMRQQYSSHYEMFFLLPLKWKICSQVLATNQEIFRLWQGRRRRQVKFNLCISFLSVRSTLHPWIQCPMLRLQTFLQPVIDWYSHVDLNVFTSSLILWSEITLKTSPTQLATSQQPVLKLISNPHLIL